MNRVGWNLWNQLGTISRGKEELTIFDRNLRGNNLAGAIFVGVFNESILVGEALLFSQLSHSTNHVCSLGQ